jgi:hypothetical protein
MSHCLNLLEPKLQWYWSHLKFVSCSITHVNSYSSSRFIILIPPSSHVLWKLQQRVSTATTLSSPLHQAYKFPVSRWACFSLRYYLFSFLPGTKILLLYMMSMFLSSYQQDFMFCFLLNLVVKQIKQTYTYMLFVSFHHHQVYNKMEF